MTGERHGSGMVCVNPSLGCRMKLNSSACGYLMCIVILSVCVVFLCVRAVLTVLMFHLDAGLLARSQYPEGPALTGHLDTGFSWFLCV
jgi:hypothetical protein